MGVEEFRARGELVMTSVSGTMYRAVAAERDKWPGFSRHAFAPFRRCLIFSPRFNISSMCPVCRESLVGGVCKIRFPPRNLLKIYSVPFCVGYSPAWNQMLLSRVCFSDCVFSRTLVDGERQ